jgi:hypothetical protein
VSRRRYPPRAAGAAHRTMKYLLTEHHHLARGPGGTGSAACARPAFGCTPSEGTESSPSDARASQSGTGLLRNPTDALAAAQLSVADACRRCERLRPSCSLLVNCAPTILPATLRYLKYPLAAFQTVCGTCPRQPSADATIDEPLAAGRPRAASSRARGCHLSAAGRVAAVALPDTGSATHEGQRMRGARMSYISHLHSTSQKNSHLHGQASRRLPRLDTQQHHP